MNPLHVAWGHCGATDSHRVLWLPRFCVLTFIRRLVTILLRFLMIAAGLVFAAVLLVAGLAFTLVLLVWSLVRGRRPRVVKFRVDPGFGTFRGATRPQGEVVDIEAREVPDAPQQLKRD